MAELIDQVSTVGPIDAVSADNAKDIADAATEAAIEQGDLPKGTITHGPADAYRHCVWSCEMTKSIGLAQAKEVGDIHEEHGKGTQSKKAANMDRCNNATGRQEGQVSENCAEDCLYLVPNLKVLPWQEWQ